MKGVIKGASDHLTYWIDGREVTQEEFDREFPPQPLGDGSGLCGWKPISSDALAVHPSDVRQAEQDAKEKGVPTSFLPDGRPVLTSRSHRKQYLKAYGFHDRQGGYGD